MKDSRAIGFLQVILAALLWGTLGLFGRSLTAFGVEATLIVAIRILIAFIALLIYLTLIENKLPKIHIADFPLLILYTFISVIAYNFFYF